VNIWKDYPEDVRELDGWLPSDDQFDDMYADENYTLNEPHPYDHLCDPEEIQNLAVASF